jgi:hypothetical protein
MIYIFSKDGKIKAHDYYNEDISEIIYPHGFELTATILDPSYFIEQLCNEMPDEDILRAIKNLSKKTKDHE